MLKVISSRVKVPEVVKNHQDMLYDYLQQFQDESSGKIDYPAMGRDLAAFDFDMETNFGIVPRSSAGSITEGAKSLAGD